MQPQTCGPTSALTRSSPTRPAKCFQTNLERLASATGLQTNKRVTDRRSYQNFLRSRRSPLEWAVKAHKTTAAADSCSRGAQTLSSGTHRDSLHLRAPGHLPQIHHNSALVDRRKRNDNTPQGRRNTRSQSSFTAHYRLLAQANTTTYQGTKQATEGAPLLRWLVPNRKTVRSRRIF